MVNDHLKTIPQYILPKHLLTSFAGLLADVKHKRIKNRLIKRFIRTYDIDMTEALEENPEHYPSFNDFFIRRLKPECRPIADADIISPVDGFVSEIGRIEKGQIFQAKGRHYDVNQLLNCSPEMSAPFENGHFATLYLSPKDYHRVHMPIDATLKEMIFVPGKLFSVQPTTARVIPHLFARNERLVVFFDTQLGPMAMVLVGATIVGGIATSWHGDIVRSRKSARFIYPASQYSETDLTKAEEMGYFKLGSTVVLLFGNDCPVEWRHDLESGTRIKLGEPLASLTR
jgi:phosphatidylserine decarboxylase